MVRQIAAVAIGILVAVAAIFAVFDVRGTGGILEVAQQLTDSERAPSTWR
jgi:hypothetical protein